MNNNNKIIRIVSRVHKQAILPVLSMLLLFMVATTTLAQAATFVATPTTASRRTTSIVSSSFMGRQPPITCTFATSTSNKKGFGEKEPSEREKSQAQVKREADRSRYDDIVANRGGQEYSIFVRQFGSDDKGWLPCGSIAVPRTAQVSDAIFANEDALKQSIVRTFPKLKGYEAEFEYGFNLKIYPDDPILVASKVKRDEGWSVGNWISNLLSPIDTSNVKRNE